LSLFLILGLNFLIKFLTTFLSFGESDDFLYKLQLHFGDDTEEILDTILLTIFNGID